MKKEEFLIKLKKELETLKNSRYTTENYLKANKELLDFFKKSPLDITKEDVEKFVKEKISNRAPSSIVVFLSGIKFASSNLLNKDLTLGIKRPKKEKKIPIILTKEEVKKLIEVFDSEKSRLMVSLIYGCGFKVSEFVNLKVSDFDLNEKRGFVGKNKRLFNIPIILLDDLKQQIEKQKEKNQEYLFTGSNGKLTDRNIQKIVRNGAKRAGIEKPVHVHTLRHSFATHLLDNGAEIREVQLILGHSSVTTTEIYNQISRNEINIYSPLDKI